MSNNKNKLRLVITTGAILFLGLLTNRTASAGVIFHDQFGRTGNLAASTPAPTDTGGATWSVATQDSSDVPTTDGTAAVFPSISNTSSATASLQFTVTSPAIYSLSTTIIPTANSNNTDWMAMGFGNTSGTVYINNSTTQAWILYREDGGTQYFYGGGTSHGGSGATTATTGTADTFTITLNTSTGAVNFSDTLGLISASGTLTPTQISGINDIVIADYNTAGGDFQNVELTGPVPEPSSLTLLGCAAAGLWLVGRKRCAKRRTMRADR